MSAHGSWKGSWTALVTPMHPDGRLDLPAWRGLIEWQLAAGTQGLVVAGSTGEGITLSLAEQMLLLEEALEIVQGRVPVCAGTGHASTAKAIEMTQAARDVGAAGALIVTPYYNRPTQQGLYAHFSAIARALQEDSPDLFPLMLYNVPKRTACDLWPETVCRLVQEHPSIVAIKEATGDLQRLAALRAGLEALAVEQEEAGSFRLFSGDDETAGDFILAGGHGVISVVSNALPDKMRFLSDAALAQDRETLAEWQKALAPFLSVLSVEPNPIPIKWMLYAMGKISEGIRLPLTVLSAMFQAPLLEQIRLLEKK